MEFDWDGDLTNKEGALMLTRTFLISCAICIAAGFGAYYEELQSQSPLAYEQKNQAELQEGRAYAEQLAQSVAQEALAQGSCTNDTYYRCLQLAREYVAKNSSLSKMPATHSQNRNSYLLLLLVSALVAFFSRRTSP